MINAAEIKGLLAQSCAEKLDKKLIDRVENKIYEAAKNCETSVRITVNVAADQVLLEKYLRARGFNLYSLNSDNAMYVSLI